MLNDIKVIDSSVLLSELKDANQEMSQVIGSIRQIIWFKDAKAANSISVSDLYLSKVGNLHTVAYTCPIRSDEGHLLGYFSTRFNWNYIYDIIDSVLLASVKLETFSSSIMMAS